MICEFKMAKGNEKLTMRIAQHNILGVIEQQYLPVLEHPLAAIEQAIKSPIETPPLLELLQRKQPQSVAIVVNDVTRPTPYQLMLPPLLATLRAVGIRDDQITLVIATGIHRPNTRSENERIFGREIVERLRLISHNPDDDLVNCGVLSDGQELFLNKWVANADFIINTGLITLHYFAGFSGGRKSTLPGVASREMIEYNHSRMNEPGCSSGSIATNPVHKTMLEAARIIGVDFILNVVTNSTKQIVAVVAGDVEEAWLVGTEICRQCSTVTIAERADVVIVSAGGYPKDINLYQAQKALEHAAQATNPGGTIIICASCAEGYGEDVFEQWMDEAECWQDLFDHFERGFELGGHKAFALARAVADKQVIWVSDLTPAILENIMMDHAASLEEALDRVRDKHGADYKAYIMPAGASVLPIVSK